ncbi:hypothetical protein DFH09DRAFT_1404367 [Mycena vulgaris]|nr:hypothetical protein DFH09DRAFT_1404367 [Mycena vulgaris]
MADDKRVKFQQPKKSPLRLQRAVALPAGAAPHASATPPQETVPTLVSVPPPQLQAPAFAILMNTRLALLSANDTICMQRSASSSTLSSTLPSSPAFSPTLLPLPTPMLHAPAKTSPKTHMHIKPKAGKACSPIKGLFASPPSPPTPAPANGVIRVLRLPLVAVDEDGKAWINEEGWVDDNVDAFGGDTEVEGDALQDEGEDMFGEEGGEDGEADDDEGDDTFDESALPTPVPRAWCFADAIPIEVEPLYAAPDTPRESGYMITSPYPTSPVASPVPASPYAATAPVPPSPYAADAPTVVGRKCKCWSPPSSPSSAPYLYLRKM